MGDEGASHVDLGFRDEFAKGGDLSDLLEQTVMTGREGEGRGGGDQGEVRDTRDSEAREQRFRRVVGQDVHEGFVLVPVDSDT